MKKGEGEKVEEYRGMTVMPSTYKVYAMVLAERLEEEIETKKALAQNQMGFRKGKGKIDEIYVLNYLVNRQVGKKKGGVVALFINLKAAFDSVDREILREAMRERRIREGLIESVMEMMGETKSTVRTGREKVFLNS